MRDPGVKAAAESGSESGGMSVQSLAEQRLLEHYAPPYVITNTDGDLLYRSARAGKYFELPPGPPDNNIFNTARHGLRLDLRAAVHRAITTNQAVVQRNVAVGTDGGQQRINLIARPLRTDGSAVRLCMLVFQDIGSIQPLTDGEEARTDYPEGSTLQSLETELRATRERLQTTTEELESSNEELKSGNEELQTVNAELKSRVDDLSRANSDIANLLESTQIATVFLDRRLTVQSFTPLAKDLFHLVDSDTGRSITHVRARFSNETIEEDAARVLRTLRTIEKQVTRADGDARYIMRMLPYRTIDDVIAGVVITFIDITQITLAEARIGELTRDLRNRVESLETLLNLVPVAIFFSDSKDGDYVRGNRSASLLLGNADNQKGLRKIPIRYRIFEDDREIPLEEQPLQRAARGTATAPLEALLVREDASTLRVMIMATPLFDDAKVPRGAIAAVVDITARKEADAAQTRLLHELQHRVKNALATVNALAARMLLSNPNPADFSKAFLARLSAMSAMHELLSAKTWEGAELHDVVLAALKPYTDAEHGANEVRGPRILLAPNAASTLGMALHELATNASKYGALASSSGRIDVSWDVREAETAPQVFFRWSERDGPPVATPQQYGFGTGFLTRGVQYELDGNAELKFEPDGIKVELNFPLAKNGELIANPGAAGGAGDG